VKVAVNYVGTHTTGTPVSVSFAQGSAAARGINS
jgi:hypothetical protein